jgi:Zn-dependent peptidase ImmA (M78 family)
MARQSLLRAALEEEDDARSLGFVASMRLDDGIDAVLDRLRELLGVTVAEYRSQRSPDAGFRLLRQAAERAGVFVLLASDLGSHHTSLDVETFRGFAIADPVAPFVVINNLDARAAWTFTLLHELVHVLLGNTGVSGTDLARDVERFCDQVAADYLLPRSELRGFAIAPGISPADLAAQISRFADGRHVSRSMVAVGLWSEHMISWEQRSAVMSLFRRQWRESRVVEREAAGEGGPDYFVVRRHRLGNALVDTTARLLHNGVLSRSKAGWLLGVKPFYVDRLTSAPIPRSSSRPA